MTSLVRVRASAALGGIEAAWRASLLEEADDVQVPVSLLEFAEACDVPVKWSCRTGVCHTCVTGLISGEVSYRPDPLEPAPPGSALICCSKPDGELALDL